MKKLVFILGLTILFFSFTGFLLSSKVYANNKNINKNIIIKNQLFSITIPNELKNKYDVKKTKDKIDIFHRDSKNAGFGGFAFGIKAYKNPSDHAVLPGSRKLGELTDKNGQIYDIVLKHPTDVQYDYTKGTEPPKEFKNLYNLGDSVSISGVKGAKYYKQKGTKGKDLYNKILEKHLTAINERWDSNKLEQENISYMYNVIAQSNNKPLDKIGYAYYDVNVDGIEELLIGEISEGNWEGVIYDIYTMVDRKPAHVISGGARNRYYVCDNSFICNEYSSGAGESGLRVYNLVENSTELYPQVGFKYDIYTNKKNPWFLSYSSDIENEKWENVSKETYEERKLIFNKYERFNFIPFSTLE